MYNLFLQILIQKATAFCHASSVSSGACAGLGGLANAWPTPGYTHIPFSMLSLSRALSKDFTLETGIDVSFSPKTPLDTGHLRVRFISNFNKYYGMINAKIEVSILELKENGKKYKVTKRVPEFLISETKMFESKEEAIAQMKEWLN